MVIDPLVSTEWLAAHLGEPDLRVLDCTVFLRRGDDGRMVAEGGRETYLEGHIPGDGFADLPGELSDRNTSLRFMMPPAEQFAKAMSAYGVGEGTRVVLYDRATNAWAARIWWMLRAFGFDDAAVLDGGWKKWTLEGREVASGASSAAPAARFLARPREGLIASRDDVLRAIESGASCVVNALSEEQHRGEGANAYGRPGHIPSSVNVPSGALVDPETNAYLPLDQLRARFEAVGATSAPVITYCGGGIAASSDAFVLTMLGVEPVAVYDGSLSEWATDPALPLEVG